jgi:hypothetical protein
MFGSSTGTHKRLGRHALGESKGSVFGGMRLGGALDGIWNAMVPGILQEAGSRTAS